VACGDGWAPDRERQGEGWNVVIARSNRGDALVREAAQNGTITVAPITEEMLLAMHSHGIDLKKRGAFIRMKLLRALGRPVPRYHVDAPMRGGAARTLIEVVLDVLFWACGLRLSRWVVNRIPARLLGRMFQGARRVWITLTRKHKRAGIDRRN
jgi:hypothetical protein